MRRVSCLIACLLILPAMILALGLHAEEPAAKPDPAVGRLVQGNNQFALDLYAKLRTQDGNLFFSPYSISTALGMTYAGARGETAEQMATTLHFGKDQEKLHPAFSQLIKQINGDGKPRGYELYTANALWLQNDYHFLPEFLKLTKTNYGAELREVDFVKATEQARLTINGWVEKQTKDKIKELFKPGILDQTTRLVLTNAIYFKGNWASPFKKEITRDEPFLTAADKKVDVPMMQQIGTFNYLQSDNLQLLEMEFGGKELSMVVLLPKQVDGLADLEKNLTAEKLQAWFSKLHKANVLVFLPRFKTTSEFQLNGTLSDMGMKRAFDPAADFSGMTGSRDLHISAVVHKAFVDVNEEGTEAAAATGVAMAVSEPSGLPG